MRNVLILDLSREEERNSAYPSCYLCHLVVDFAVSVGEYIDLLNRDEIGEDDWPEELASVEALNVTYCLKRNARTVWMQLYVPSKCFELVKTRLSCDGWINGWDY